MRINGTNIATLKSKLLKRTILPASKEIAYEFLSDQSLNAIKTRETGYQFNSIELIIAIIAITAQEIEEIKGNLALLFSECTLEFDDIEDRIYIGHLVEIGYEFISYNMCNLNVKLNAISYGNELSVTITNNSPIIVESDCITPCIVEIIPPIGMGSLIINGLARDNITGINEPIFIRNLTKDAPIVINGIECTVTENGLNKFSDCEMWSFPSLKPGRNEVELSSDCKIKVTYKPRYI